MRTFLKILLALVVLLIVGVGSYVAYVYFSEKGEERDVLEVVPSDAIYILETPNSSKAWNTINQSGIWQQAVGCRYFADIDDDMASIDSLLTHNKVVSVSLRDRKMAISTHLSSDNNYDFLFVVDVEKASKMKIVKETLFLLNLKVETSSYKGLEINEMSTKDGKRKFYLSFVDNLLIISFNKSLVEKSIDQKDEKRWATNSPFQEVSQDVRHKKLFNLYINYSGLEKLVSIYLSEHSEIMDMAGKSLAYSAFGGTLESHRLNLEGFTNTSETSSYLKALSRIAPDKVRACDIISDQMAAYISMNFSNFDSFFESLQKEFSDEKGNEFGRYSQRIDLIERTLQIDLQKDLFSWIGNEIALIKLRSQNPEDILVSFHSKDIEQAQLGLKHIIDQIHKRTPSQFSLSYKGHEIRAMNTEKGFFMLLFGKLFQKLEKPYFTTLENYVIFSNSLNLLKQQIDDYNDGRTLSHHADFTNFKDEFAVKSNANIFIQMPKAYNLVSSLANPEKRKSIEGNKDLVQSFARLGFQLEARKYLYKNTLIIDHNANAAFEDYLEKLQLQACNELLFQEFDSLTYKPDLNRDLLSKDGAFKVTLNNLRYEGSIRGGSLNGITRTFYKSGNLKSLINYQYNKATGQAWFYYDDKSSTKRVELTFEDDKISDIYKEYYSNGSRKAVLNFSNNKPHGTAQYFYESGIVQIEGQYKKGLQNGTWKYFDPNGELLDKERWRRGIKK